MDDRPDFHRASQKSDQAFGTDGDPQAGRNQPEQGKGTRLDQIADLLKRTGGASLDELCAATGWQAHSVRGAISGALKKKGHTIVSERIDGVRRYRIGE